MHITATILASAILTVSGWFGVEQKTIVHEVICKLDSSYCALGANSTISNLTAKTDLAGTDTMVIVDNSVSPATTKKITLANATSSFKTYNDLIYSPIAGSASITTLGTIGTGSWNATAIPVSKGGTGTTSPALNYIILGNTTSGFKTVDGQGTSGYLLTSNGAGSAPTWQNVAVALNTDNTWTGSNTFNATSTFNGTTTMSATTSVAASSLSGKPFIINTVPYQYPSTQCISGQTLVNDGTGILSCRSIVKYSYVGVGPNAVSGSATTTLFTIPAGTMKASSTIEVSWDGTSLYNGGGGTVYFGVGNGVSSTTIMAVSCSEGTNTETAQCSAHFLISFNSPSSQSFIVNGIQETQQGIGTVMGSGSSGTASVDFTGAQQIDVWALAPNASNNMNVTALKVVVNP